MSAPLVLFTTSVQAKPTIKKVKTVSKPKRKTMKAPPVLFNTLSTVPEETTEDIKKETLKPVVAPKLSKGLSNVEETDNCMGIKEVASQELVDDILANIFICESDFKVKIKDKGYVLLKPKSISMTLAGVKNNETISISPTFELDTASVARTPVKAWCGDVEGVAIFSQSTMHISYSEIGNLTISKQAASSLMYGHMQQAQRIGTSGLKFSFCYILESPWLENLNIKDIGEVVPNDSIPWLSVSEHCFNDLDGDNLLCHYDLCL
jgi:hypothetical protein